MSTWTSPATWANAAVTAAQMNTEIRDHLLWLKGAINVMTESSAVDTGTAMYLWVNRPNASDPAFIAKMVGDTTGNRLILRANGQIEWGAGGTSAMDASISRSGASILRSGASFEWGTTGAVLVDAGYVKLFEITDPGAGAANSSNIYARDNGAGKTQLCVVFSSGAVQVLATQP